jgi:hypothetical protein
MAYDSEYDGRMLAATRNIEAIFVALNHFESKRTADAQRVEDLMMGITQLTQQVNGLNQKVVLLQAQLYQAGIR